MGDTFIENKDQVLNNQITDTYTHRGGIPQNTLESFQALKIIDIQVRLKLPNPRILKQGEEMSKSIEDLEQDCLELEQDYHEAEEAADDAHKLWQNAKDELENAKDELENAKEKTK